MRETNDKTLTRQTPEKTGNAGKTGTSGNAGKAGTSGKTRKAGTSGTSRLPGWPSPSGDWGLQNLYNAIVAYFSEAMPEVETELHYETPFQLLVAVILSAQCTDKRVNQITPPLFHDYPTAEAMAEATPEVIFEYIRSVSYPNNKAKHLVGMARMLLTDFGGEIPDNLDDLTRLPGVGRKTANVIQAVIYNKAAMAVDTHIFRVSHRLGLVPDHCNTPYAVEMELTKHFPPEVIPRAHHWLLLHGRYICQARTPKCEKCPIANLCKSYRKQ